MFFDLFIFHWLTQKGLKCKQIFAKSSWASFIDKISIRLEWSKEKVTNCSIRIIKHDKTCTSPFDSFMHEKILSGALNADNNNLNKCQEPLQNSPYMERIVKRNATTNRLSHVESRSVALGYLHSTTFA